MELEFQGSVVPEELAAELANPAPEEEVESLHRSAARTALPDQEAPVETLFRRNLSDYIIPA